MSLNGVRLYLSINKNVDQTQKSMYDANMICLLHKYVFLVGPHRLVVDTVCK